MKMPYFVTRKDSYSKDDKKQSYNLNLKFGKTNKCLFELMLCFYKRFIFLNRCF